MSVCLQFCLNLSLIAITIQTSETKTSLQPACLHWPIWPSTCTDTHRPTKRSPPLPQAEDPVSGPALAGPLLQRETLHSSDALLRVPTRRLGCLLTPPSPDHGPPGTQRGLRASRVEGPRVTVGWLSSEGPLPRRSFQVNMHTQFHSRGAFMAADAGGHRHARNRPPLEWHVRGSQYGTV